MALMQLSLNKDVAPAPNVHVLKAAEYAVFLETRELLEMARIAIATMHEKAESDCKVLRRQGHEEGIQEGKNEIAEQYIEAVTASVEQMATMETALVDVVVKSLRTILGSFDNEELVVQVVGHALRLVRDEKRIILRLAAEDVPGVEKRLHEITTRYPGMGRVDIAADNGISHGGCIIETDIGVIDATLERQLTIIEDSFRRHLEERHS